MKAPDILDKALKEQEDRATTYDRKGERSIPRTVNAFNAITGHELSREEGWLFMLLLKAVRSQQGDYRDDNYVDGSSYFSLMGEQAAEDRNRGPYFTGEPPSWDELPDRAEWLTQDQNGRFDAWQGCPIPYSNDSIGYWGGGNGIIRVLARGPRNPNWKLAIEPRPETRKTKDSSYGEY